jgi:Polysaccharide lyase family 4, domain II
VMKAKPVVLIAVAIGFAVGMISCGGGSSTTTEQPAAGAPAAGGGTAVDASTAGTVTGTIKLDGTAPKMKVINMAAEPACAKVHTTPAMTEDVIPGDGGTLQNVVVYLKGDFSQYKLDVPTSPAMIDQKGCQYSPHVLALMTNQPLQVVNSDMTTHNIHPVPKNNREWNESQPPGSQPINQMFAREEVAVPVKCNVHPWMKAYIAVVGSPYFQVTGKDGSFSLKNVPPGTYTVSAWHESLGTQEQMVTVGPKESKAVTLTFKAAATSD